VNAIDRYFFSPLYVPRSAWNVIEWWESRRALYNVCVGAAGLLTLTTASLTMHLPPAVPHAGVPWPAVGVYALLANVCYSFGAPIDLFLRRFIGPHAAVSGPVLFRYGFVFSLGLTLLPIPLFMAGWVIRLFGG